MKREGFYHISFAVEHTNKAFINAKNNDFQPVNRTARKGAEDLNIIFLSPKNSNEFLSIFRVYKNKKHLASNSSYTTNQ